MGLRVTGLFPLMGRWNLQYIVNGGAARTLSAGTHWVGTLFQAEKTGTITEVHFRSGSVSSPVFTLEAGIVTPDANGFPLGADISIADAVTNPSANTNYSATGLSASVTRGTFYCAVVRMKSYTSGNVSVAAHFPAEWGGNLNYGGSIYNVGSNAKQASVSQVSVKYSDGWAPSIHYSSARSAGINVATGTSSGNVQGNKFNLKHRVRVVGYAFSGDPDAHNIEMYSGSDNTAMTNSSVAITSAYRTSTNLDYCVAMLATPIILNPGTYRVGMRNTSTTSSNVSYCNNFADSSASQTVVDQATDWMQTTYASSAWTDTSTALIAITPICDAYDDGLPGPILGLGI